MHVLGGTKGTTLVENKKYYYTLAGACITSSAQSNPKYQHKSNILAKTQAMVREKRRKTQKSAGLGTA